MCFDCPRQLQPPTQQLKKSRLLLQMLAAGLFILSIFALVAGQGFSIFLLLLLSYILYLSWSEFNYLMTLNFFLLTSIQTLIVYVEIIGLIQYSSSLNSSNASKTLYIIAKMVYFPNAVFYSHWAYRQFKQYALIGRSGNFSFGNQEMEARNNENPTYPQNFQRSNEPIPRNNANFGQFRPFQGQGISIS